MAEFTRVEKPFLEKLKSLGWQVIIHPSQGIPQDPSVSLRSDFKSVTLKEEFKKAVKKVNQQSWLTDTQLETLYQEITATERSNLSLIEANEIVFNRLIGKTKTTVSENVETGEQDVLVKLIDFNNWQQNSYTAINQFRVVTPGRVRSAIIPDIVLFVNGLPFCVIECKDVDVVDPLSEGFIQVDRYRNTREDLFGGEEGEERLFHYNLFSIITHGGEARLGTITGDFQKFLNWKDIFPTLYKTFDIDSYSEEEIERYGVQKREHKEPAVRQKVMIHGLLNQEVLIDVLQHFTLFKKTDEKVIKIVSRYQQYRAVGKMLDQLRNGEDYNLRSGVVWHTQGSGKSLTMIFFILKLRSQPDLKDYKVILTVDRKDLENQLSGDAALTGEFKEKNIISSRRELVPKLSGDASDLSLVMIHKFMEEETRHTQATKKAFESQGAIPKFKDFPKVNDSDRIVFLIDEAHRTQGGDMSENLFKAFPQSSKIAFTGTPLLTDRHKRKTHERFGGNSEFIDTYKIREAVRDRATLDIRYMGKTTKDEIDDKEVFDRKFEDIFSNQDALEKELIQKKYGSLREYLASKNRIKKIAEDLVNHYVDNILPEGFKAMVVSSSVMAAARYENFIKIAIDNRIQAEEAKQIPDQSLITKLRMLDACTVISPGENNVEDYIIGARKKAKELKAVDNFKRSFDFSKDDGGQYQQPETGIAFLCVCDRLLTGFDAPIAQVMYLDKNLKEHDLLQAVARVNRPKEEKEHGILVDYYGVSNNLYEALNIWGSEDEEDIKELLAHFRDINAEVPVLEARYLRVMQLFEDKGIMRFTDFVQQQMEDEQEEIELVEACIELAKAVPFRAQFDTYLKAFFDSLDLLFNTQVADQYYIPAKRLGYLLIRIRNRYKDRTMDLKWAKAKVRKLIDDHLQTLDIDSRIPPVELLSEQFPAEMSKLKSPKAKASEMEHAIRRHIKANSDQDPAMYKRFYKRMQEALDRYKDNWEMILESLEEIKSEMEAGREVVDNQTGLNAEQLPYYDLILEQIADKTEIKLVDKEVIKLLTVKLVNIIEEHTNIPNFWKERAAEVDKLEGMIQQELVLSDVEAISEHYGQLSTEIMALAKNRSN